MSFADVNATVTSPTGITIARRRGRVVHPETPSLGSDVEIRNTDGTPFRAEDTGVPVKFGDIPIERRWCVDEDGKLLAQRDFEDKHLHWYVLHFQSKGKQPDDPTSRPIPRVERFASEGVAPDGEHYRTHGFDPHREAEGPVVRPEGFSPVAKDRPAGYEPVRETDAEAKASAAEERAASAEAKADALEARLAALENAGPPQRRVARTPRPTITADCGKVIGGNLGQHVKHCKDGCQAEEGSA